LKKGNNGQDNNQTDIIFGKERSARKGRLQKESGEENLGVVQVKIVGEE